MKIRPDEIDDAIDCLDKAEGEANAPMTKEEIEDPSRPPRRNMARGRAYTV